MSNVINKTTTLTVNVASISTEFLIAPFAWVAEFAAKDTAWGAKGIIHRLTFSPALPNGSVVNIYDTVDGSGRELSGGAGTADPDPDWGGKNQTALGAFETDANSDAGAITALAQPEGSTHAGCHVYSRNSADSNWKSKYYMAGPVADLEMRVECWSSMIVSVDPGSAWAGSVAIEFELSKPGHTRYREFQRNVLSDDVTAPKVD